MFKNHIDRRNLSGTPDPTAYSALTRAQRETEVIDARAKSVIRAIYTLTNAADFTILNRIELHDRKSGRNYR